jgi:hypothetical protein
LEKTRENGKNSLTPVWLRNKKIKKGGSERGRERGRERVNINNVNE